MNNDTPQDESTQGKPKNRTGLLYELRNGGRKDPFPSNTDLWDKASAEQLEAWKQAALERDAGDLALAKEIATRLKQIDELLLDIYGNSRNYKNKPIDYATKLGDKIKNYLHNETNHPLQRFYRDYWIERYNREIERLEKARQAKAEAALKQQKAQDKARKEQETLMQLGIIANRHGIALEDVSTARDLMYDLAEKDKYLNLALAGEETRGDWRDGFYRVKSAHRSFKVETEIDKAIEAEYEGILQGDESDGRIFRDCEFSYDVLYGMVADEQLLRDFRTLQEMID